MLVAPSNDPDGLSNGNAEVPRMADYQARLVVVGETRDETVKVLAHNHFQQLIQGAHQVEQNVVIPPSFHWVPVDGWQSYNKEQPRKGPLPQLRDGIAIYRDENAADPTRPYLVQTGSSSFYAARLSDAETETPSRRLWMEAGFTSDDRTVYCASYCALGDNLDRETQYYVRNPDGTGKYFATAEAAGLTNNEAALAAGG